MSRPTLEVADILRSYGAAFLLMFGYALSHAQRRVMNAIEACRTAALGGHVEACDQCGHQRNAYNSCRNRHFPKCQSLARAQWLEDRRADLLPVGYFHVVFTLPSAIAAIAFQNVSGGEKPPKFGGEPNHGEPQTKKGLRNADPLSWLMAKTMERFRSEWRIVVFWRGAAGRRESLPLFPDEVL